MIVEIVSVRQITRENQLALYVRAANDFEDLETDLRVRLTGGHDVRVRGWRRILRRQGPHDCARISHHIDGGHRRYSRTGQRGDRPAECDNESGGTFERHSHDHPVWSPPPKVRVISGAFRQSLMRPPMRDASSHARSPARRHAPTGARSSRCGDGRQSGCRPEAHSR